MHQASQSAVRNCAAAFALLATLVATGSPGQPAAPGTPAASTASTAAEPATKSWHFKVLLDGKPIGDHEFTVNRHAQDVDVHTSAHFKVKVAFISLYHYDHDDHERWTNGCLAQIDARTDDNGKQVEVRGSVAGEKFELSSPATGTTGFQDCVRTFAYWDRAALSVTRMLNSGTGEYTPIELVHRGSEHISVNDRPTEAEHDSLKTNKFAIELWYSKSGEWLALQTLTEGGRTLRYEAQ